MSGAIAGCAPDAFDFLCTLLRRRSAIELDASKAYLVESRLAPVAQRGGFTAIADMIAALRQKPGSNLEKQVIEAMTTNESSFFRDVHPFEALKLSVLPQLVERRSTERSLKIWSAACSSGQELYTIAMIIREQFPELLNWKLQLVGTDLSTEILRRAQEGLFSQVEVNRGLPANLLLKYFRKTGLSWQISDELRKMAQFVQLNLIGTYPATLQSLDVVFLRNVLIYFSPETKRAVLAKVRRVLRPDGFLFLGGAETTMNLDDSFERVEWNKSVCYRLKAAAQKPSVASAATPKPVPAGAIHAARN